MEMLIQRRRGSVIHRMKDNQKKTICGLWNKAWQFVIGTATCIKCIDPDFYQSPIGRKGHE